MCRRNSNIIIALSLLIGIMLSVTFVLSAHFPVLTDNTPLATVDHLPQAGVSLLLEQIRVRLTSGYEIEASLLAIGLAGIIYKTKDRVLESAYSKRVSLILLSAAFGLLNTSGLYLYWKDSMPHEITGTIAFLLLSAGWMTAFYISAILSFDYLDKHSDMFAAKVKDVTASDRRHFVTRCFALIMVGWLIWIIPYYPASMDNDVFAQLSAWLEIHNDHHPWFATCLIGFCYDFGHRLRSDNLGVFIFVIIRDVIIALMFAEVVWTMKSRGLPRWLYLATAVYYAITPFFGAYAKHAFKDTLSMGLFCGYVLTTYLLADDVRNNKMIDNSLIWLHGIIVLLTAMSRHNCIYAILPAEIILIAVLIIKKQKNKVLIIVLFTTVFFMYQHSLVYFGIQPGPAREALSLPAQQIARVYRDHGDELSRDDLSELEQFCDTAMLDKYDPVISDQVKLGLKIGVPGVAVSSDFVKLWAKWAFKYPKTYYEAAVGQSYGYYAFTPRLPEQSGNWNSGMTIFDWIGCNGDYDENFDFHYMKWSYGLRSVLHAWAKVWDEVPVLCLTDICAMYTWLTLLSAYYLLSKRQYLLAVPLIPVLLMIGTCIASPVNDCFRYFAPAAASLPVVICCIASFREEESSDLS